RPPTVYALLQVALEEPSVPGTGQKAKPIENEFLIYRGTQLTLLKSRLVLKAALKQKDVAELALIKKLDDPVAWLEENLLVDVPHNGAVIRVGLNGDQPKELTVLVNAVVEAYLKEIVNRIRNLTQDRIDQLKEIASKYEQEIERKKATMRQIMQRSVAVADPRADQIRQRLAEEAVANASRELQGLHSQLRTLKVEMASLQARLNTVVDQVITDRMINDHLAKVEPIAGFLKEIDGLQKDMELTKEKLKDPEQSP